MSGPVTEKSRFPAENSVQAKAINFQMGDAGSTDISQHQGAQKKGSSYAGTPPAPIAAQPSIQVPMASHDKAVQLARTFFLHRAPFDTNEDFNIDDVSRYPHKIVAQFQDDVEKGRTTVIAMNAFPFKSVLDEKTLPGKKGPDGAERVNIRAYAHIAEHVAASRALVDPDFKGQGAKAVIISDGGVFEPFLPPQYDKETRLNYISQLKEMIQEEGKSDIVEVLPTEQPLAGQVHALMEPRDSFMKKIELKEEPLKDKKTGETVRVQNGKKWKDVKVKVPKHPEFDPDTAKLYEGQTGFWKKEMSVLKSQDQEATLEEAKDRGLVGDEVKVLSKTKFNALVSAAAADISVDITIGSNALSTWVDKNHPEWIRASCHPKEWTPESRKTGVRLEPNYELDLPDTIEMRQKKVTGWHGVGALHEYPDKWKNIHNDLALQLVDQGLLELKIRSGTPHHYEVPELLGSMSRQLSRSPRQFLDEVTTMQRKFRDSRSGTPSLAGSTLDITRLNTRSVTPLTTNSQTDLKKVD